MKPQELITELKRVQRNFAPETAIFFMLEPSGEEICCIATYKDARAPYTQFVITKISELGEKTIAELFEEIAKAPTISHLGIL